MKRTVSTIISVLFFSVLCHAAETVALTASPGETITTGGWADKAGMSYQKAQIQIIDDKTYPDPLKKLSAFKSVIASDLPQFIVLDGDIDVSGGKVTDSDHSYFEQFGTGGARKNADFVLPMGSNTTLIGRNNARIMYGGIRIKEKRNIIIRNITFYDDHGSTEIDTKVKKNSKASADALSIEGASSAVWIDHCTFTDGVCVDLERNYNHDGALDIKQGKNITISFCEFTNHDKVMLVCPSDKYTRPEDCQITLHHNYFHGTIQRMPRSRGTQMHIYNNVYDNIGIKENTGSSLGPGIASQYIVENNYFGKHAGSIVKYYDPSEKNAPTFSRIYHRGNIPELSDAVCSYDKVDKLKSFRAHETSEMPWSIPYSYTLESAEEARNTVPSAAGSGKTVTIGGI